MKKLSKKVIAELKKMNLSLSSAIMIQRTKVNEDELMDLEAFIDFCKLNNLSDMILPTLVHDVTNFYHKTDFVPRTFGYRKNKKFREVL